MSYSSHRLFAPFVGIAMFAHPSSNDFFPISYPPERETPTFNRGLATRFSKGATQYPSGMIGPTYILNIPFTPSPDAQSSHAKWTHLTRVIREESFGQNSISSRLVVQQRIFANIGINRGRSLDPEEDRAVLKWARGIATHDLGFPCRTITTLWETSFRLFFQGAFHFVGADDVQPAFVVLEYLAEARLIELAKASFSNELLRNQIPFSHIREWIKNDTFQLNGFDQSVSICPAYLSIMDDDPISFRSQYPLGLFSVYDNLVKKNTTLPQLMSTGYFADPEESLGTGLALSLDMGIRAAISQYLPLAPYYPEPNTCVLLTDPKLRMHISYLNKQSLDTENRRLVTNLGVMLDPRRVKFEAVACLSTAIPSRMQFSKNLSSFTFESLGKKETLKALRGISQTHAKPSILSNNIYVSIAHKGVSICDFKSVFSCIFQCFDPIALAQAMPKKGNYHWKNFKFLMGAYPEWFTRFSEAATSPSTRVAHRRAWGLHAKGLADNLLPGGMTAQNYADAFQAYLEQFDKAMDVAFTEFHFSRDVFVPVMQAAMAAGNMIHGVLQANIEQ